MPTNLVCKQCGHENEPQRIYCHECGSKLDRSILPPEPDRQVVFEEQRRRVQKLARPDSGLFSGWFKSLTLSIGCAALVAALVLMAQTPEDAPPMASKEKALDAPPVALALEEAVYGPVSKPITMNEEVINLYLQGAIRAKPTGIIDNEYLFQRAYVKLDDGGIRVFAHQTVYNYPLYAGVAYTLAIKDGKLDTRNTGGWIGRLPVHPLVTQFSDYVFSKLWKALKREHETFKKVQSVEVAKDRLTVTAGGKPQ